MTTVMRDRQTLLDVALVECGDACAAFDIAAANDIGITDFRAEIVLPNTQYSNAKVVRYYKYNGIIPATGGVVLEGDRILGFGDKEILINNKNISI